jgi:nucleotide-binding universal stress UspA family protein
MAIAAAYGAAVTILHVVEPPSPQHHESPDPVEWEVHRREAGGYLTSVANRARAESPLAVATELIDGDPVVQIRRWVDAHDVDLVVLCTHGGRGHAEWPLASTARKLVDVLRCSLLVVPVTAAAAAPAIRYTRVLVPLDGSVWSESVLPVAARLAAEHDAEVLLVHAVVKPELLAFGPLTADDLDFENRLLERNERVAHAYLEHLRERLCGIGVKARTIVEREGGVRAGLLRTISREQPDLFLISASGASGHPEGPCGTVATHLLTHAGKPVLMLRHRCEAIASRSHGGPHAAPRLPTQASP